jgi:hypothetical protein
MILFLSTASLTEKKNGILFSKMTLSVILASFHADERMIKAPLKGSIFGQSKTWIRIE